MKYKFFYLLAVLVATSRKTSGSPTTTTTSDDDGQGGVTTANIDTDQKWICSTSSFCIKDPNPNVGEIPRFESQRDCRLSCGKYGAIWPMPTGECNLSNDRVYFDPQKVRINTVAPSASTAQFMRETHRIFVSNIIKECLRNCPVLDSEVEVLVKTTINSSSIALDWNTNESYKLTIRTTGTATFVDIRAETVYGARHAFETLSNLITGSSIENGLLMVRSAAIDDRPAYPHRGLLLDSSRNFMPLRIIQRTLDAMAASKSKVFHWHIVDIHNFPMEVARVPELQRFGAYSKKKVYSRSDQENLGNLAVCINQSPWTKYCSQPPCGQLNPFNDNMYATMIEIYADIAEIGAPEETIHMGGDEVCIACWNNTEEITHQMRELGLDLSLKSFYRTWHRGMMLIDTYIREIISYYE